MATPTPTPNASATLEVNFDGLVGPTHNYAGLAHGNLASHKHKLTASSPRAAALQALAKMKFLADMGVPQAVLPPHDRPDIRTLRRLGFSGSDKDVLAKAHRESPQLLAACCSASSMWAANAATVSPSADAADGRLHLTPANLTGNFHRSLEPDMTTRVLRAIFADESAFAVHNALPAGASTLCDEGAANHTRFASAFGEPGVELFAYGRKAIGESSPPPHRFRGRHTIEASHAVARLHGVSPARTVFARQSADAIDAGVFHNDVIAVGHLNVLFCHERAYVDQAAVLAELKRKFAEASAGELIVIEVAESDVPLADAVESYLFNSQLVSLADGSIAMICPEECRRIQSTRRYLDRLIDAPSPIRTIHFADVRESMKNGGGPACLRLRVVMTAAQRNIAHAGVFLTSKLHSSLTAWVHKHYRESLSPGELADPSLLRESRAALDELTQILGLGSLYDFQR